MVNSTYHRIVDCTSLDGDKVDDVLNGNCKGIETPVTLHSEGESRVVKNEMGQSDSLKCPQNIVPVNDSDYQLLPKKYFKYESIPPPLVRKTWLNLFYKEFERSRKKKKKRTESDCEVNSRSDDESNGEDSIPLSNLRLKLAGGHSERCNELREENRNEFIREKVPNVGDRLKSTVNIIQRKRGRPKKQVPRQESHGSDNDVLQTGQDFLNGVQQSIDDTDNWWNKSSDSSDDDDVPVLNSKTYQKLQDCTQDSTKTGESLQQTDEDTNKKTTIFNKGKKQSAISEFQGITLDDNSKLVFPCMECGKTFSAASTLKYHLRIHNGTLIRCTECDRGFTTNYLLKCHMRIHNGDLFMCHKCGRGFITAELLKVHSRSHTGVRPYKCEICGKSFPSGSNLSQHKETHELEKKYLCFQCGSSFSQKRCLDGHMLSHGEKNHICTVCGKMWARKSDLSEHMRVHTGYKPYACNSCPQKFTQASSLRRHQIVHKEANPVQCMTCGKMLKCDEYYKRHLKKHEKDKELQSATTLE